MNYGELITDVTQQCFKNGPDASSSEPNSTAGAKKTDQLHLKLSKHIDRYSTALPLQPNTRTNAGCRGDKRNIYLSLSRTYS